MIGWIFAVIFFCAMVVFLVLWITGKKEVKKMTDQLSANVTGVADGLSAGKIGGNIEEGVKEVNEDEEADLHNSIVDTFNK